MIILFSTRRDGIRIRVGNRFVGRRGHVSLWIAHMGQDQQGTKEGGCCLIASAQLIAGVVGYVDSRNVTGTIVSNPCLALCVFSGVAFCTQLVDSKRDSNSGPVHSRPSDMNRFRSDADEAEKPLAHPRCTSGLHVTWYGFHLPFIWRELQVDIVRRWRLCFDTQSDECSVLFCARGR